MKNLKFQSVFDIIGPVMVGPSSSHTAGAVRIGKIVSAIFGETPTEVEFQLFNSFAKTYRGHGTDVALVAGILGMETDDPDIPRALDIAYEKGITDSHHCPPRRSRNDCPCHRYFVALWHQYRPNDCYSGKCR